MSILRASVTYRIEVVISSREEALFFYKAKNQPTCTKAVGCHKDRNL